MRLAKPFYRLAVRFDAARLREEVAALSENAWAKHPNEIKGNSSVRLISVNGGENDDVNGVMLPTPHLQQSPYIRQVLASFGVVWSRSRLLRLAPECGVPEHADINYHWFNRVRLHIPIITRPEVRFFCGDQNVHMAAGEAWVFDNWRPHRVENPVDAERIHLVADTSGSAAFWQFVGRSELPGTPVQEVRYDPRRDLMPLTEKTSLAPVMSPGEVDLLTLDLCTEIVPHSDTPDLRKRHAQYLGLLDAMRRDWRQLYALYGEREEGWPEFIKLRDGIRKASRTLAEGLVTRTNRVNVHAVLEGRLLRSMLSLPAEKLAAGNGQLHGRGVEAPSATRMASPPPVSASTATLITRDRLQQPVFIIAAPRSGSTLLFETLSVNRQLYTLGGEAHWLVESLSELRPGAPDVESNRLEAKHATEAIGARIIEQILPRLQNARGQPPTTQGAVRFLEKTPKNALRIPFFNRIFPDALFIFLWRDPQENLSSIIEAWRSGQWKTYNGLDGFEGPWSLLLPPGWKALNQRPLEEIAAYQWDCTNRIVLDDLQALPRERWTTIRYGDLISEPRSTVERLCAFMHIDFDPALAERVAAPLPHSRFTLTPPAVDKWRRNESAIERVLPTIAPTWERLRSLTSPS